MLNGAFHSRGKSILEQTFVVGAAVTTFLASASRAGLCPFRLVILDASFTLGVGTSGQAPIKYPNTAFANGEKLLGVAMGPENTLKSNQGYDPSPGVYFPIPAGRSCDVRIMGIAPIMTDSTTSGTPILPGDWVAASTTSNNDGLGKKGTLTNNAPAANQHIAGLCISRASIANGVALTILRFTES